MMNGNNNNNNNSTTTTNTNTIGVEDIENIYHGGLGGQQSIYECCNKNCDLKETKKGMKFKNCSRCQGVMYCSKECQKEDWRAKHKLECIPTIGLKAVEPPKGTPEQRVGQFRELYEPMLTQIIIHMLMDGTDIQNDLLCETHVCMITLEDLPPSNSLGKSPRLMTKDIRPIPIQDLPGEMQTTCKQMMNNRPPNATNIEDLVAYCVMVYVCSETGSILTTWINSFGYDFSDNLQMIEFEKMKEYWKNKPKWEQRRMLRNNFINPISNTINEMAIGNAKELKSASRAKKW